MTKREAQEYIESNRSLIILHALYQRWGASDDSAKAAYFRPTTGAGPEMNKPDCVEIWLGDTLMLRLDSSFAPNKGDLINIKKVTYRVVGRSFTVDDADDPFLSRVRCNVIVQKQD